MVSKPVANSMLFLRIVALAASTVTIALLVTNNANFDDGSKLSFQDFNSYWYVVVASTVAGAYCIVQFPFAIYYAVKQKRLIRNEFLAEFDFYGDKVISVVLATGSAVGFAVSVEFKKFFDELFKGAGISKSNPTRSSCDKFFVRAIVASAILLLASLSMLIVSIISCIHRSKSRGIFK